MTEKWSPSISPPIEDMFPAIEPPGPERSRQNRIEALRAASRVWREYDTEWRAFGRANALGNAQEHGSPDYPSDANAILALADVFAGWLEG